MILTACTRLDTELTFRLEEASADSQAWMRSRRYWLAAVAIIASVLDLVLTQSILSAVAGLTGDQPAEANPLMASVVMTWWAWPLRVGVPFVAVLHDLKVGNFGVIAAAAGMYGCVVVWNTAIFLELPVR